MKYRLEVYLAVKDYFRYNLGQIVHTQEIDKMKRSQVLSYYLEWEGVLGYSNIILDILGYRN